MDAFYLTLPSNSSLDIFPNNRLSEYTVNFRNALPVNEEYEIGLSEFHWTNEFEQKIVITDDDFLKIDDAELALVKGEEFHNRFELIDYLNILLSHVVNQSMTKFISLNKNGKLELYQNLDLSHSLKLKLGKGDPKCFFIYCDVILESLVGDTLAPLLRIVNTEENSISSKLYTNIQYLPLSKRQVHHIAISIRDDTGELIKFSSGSGQRSIAVIHCRRRYV